MISGPKPMSFPSKLLIVALFPENGNKQYDIGS
jgi:hypothetical protein